MTGGTINPMLADLALILIVAGVVTIIFKALKQPLVLGYIIAGIFYGPVYLLHSHGNTSSKRGVLGKNRNDIFAVRIGT